MIPFAKSSVLTIGGFFDTLKKQNANAFCSLLFPQHLLFVFFFGTMFHGFTGSAKGNPVRRDFVGWTGLPPIAMLFEYVFGIQPDVPANTIRWHIQLTDAHGVERYPFGKDGLMTLHCEKRNSVDDTPRVTVTSNMPVTLELTWGSENNRKTQLLDIAERR